MIGSIQFLRGVAALLVLAFHFDFQIKDKALWGSAPFDNFFLFGHAGVEFFFVLSGFIILFVHRADIGVPQKFWAYLYRRLTRIYPLYWVVLLFYIYKTFSDGAPDMDFIARAVLLLPVDGEPLVKQAWTLSHELLFYLFFGLLILNRKWGVYGFAIWLLAIAGQFIFHFIQHGRILVFSHYNSLFFFGMFVANAYKRVRRLHGWLLLILGVIGFVATGLLENQGLLETYQTSVIPFGICSAMILMGFIAVERTGPLMARRFTDFCGDISYPLYLSHGMVGAVLIPKLHQWLPGVSPEVALLVASVLAVMAAYGLHLAIDRPLQLAARAGWQAISARHHAAPDAPPTRTPPLGPSA